MSNVKRKETTTTTSTTCIEEFVDATTSLGTSATGEEISFPNPDENDEGTSLLSGTNQDSSIEIPNRSSKTNNDKKLNYYQLIYECRNNPTLMPVIIYLLAFFGFAYLLPKPYQLSYILYSFLAGTVCSVVYILSWLFFPKLLRLRESLPNKE
jgi:hypothetical protein